MREQLEQKAQYMSAHATSNIPALVREIKASSSLAAESTKRKATKRRKVSVKTRIQLSQQGNEQVVSGPGLCKVIAIGGCQTTDSTAIGGAAIKDATTEGAANEGVANEGAAQETESRSRDDSLPAPQKTSSMTIIAEVKRMARADANASLRQKILIQESAQMAAWIAAVPMLLG
ncbi:hypothetical protein LEL_08268 [Akanthomyces lecanii RCEF 1005]|uniref:Uncharacterized protein n=1 Tax=Akanthomyces lecanii RCEF 1005 TaxID=1081108 RepID=A0A168F5C7_CORDF|nr:hypothetical protein LEL_08268 [Akanthomyces lecanii RCEF 1005]